MYINAMCIALYIVTWLTQEELGSCPVFQISPLYITFSQDDVETFSISEHASGEGLAKHPDLRSSTACNLIKGTEI